jgi:hypothetical protein
MRVTSGVALAVPLGPVLPFYPNSIRYFSANERPFRIPAFFGTNKPLVFYQTLCSDSIEYWYNRPTYRDFPPLVNSNSWERVRRGLSPTSQSVS